MPEGDTVLGLIEVLEGRETRLKKAASERLVEIGDAAVERLQMSLHDRDAEPWVTDALVDIRERRDPGGYAFGVDVEAAPADEALDEVSDDGRPHDGGYAVGEPADDPGDDAADDPGDDAADDPGDAADEPGDDAVDDLGDDADDPGDDDHTAFGVDGSPAGAPGAERPRRRVRRPAERRCHRQ